MHINEDFSRRVVVHAADLEWVASPMPGVQRRMLDRIGGEVARATSVVRYAPGSHFTAHVHGGGEEFLVLDGVFQDEQGDYPVGCYVRNPPTSSHTPRSESGCVILVKLHQFDPADRRHVRVDTGGMTPAAASGRPGVGVVPLFADAREQVRIEHWAPAARLSLHAEGGLEAFVLDGGFVEGGEEFRPWSWLRLPRDALLDALAGEQGARVWVKSGHLAHES